MENETPAAKTSCGSPITLVRSAVDTTTGELSERTIEKDCGSRLEAKCPHCSSLYRGDCFAIIRSGLTHEDGRPKLLSFLTFTAPGADTFGPIHQRTVAHRKGGGDVVRKCRCGEVHSEDDPAVGTPLNPETYRYDLAADFNASSSRLLAVTMQKLGRVVGRKLRYVRVAEYQRRGLIHFHVLVEGIITDRALNLVVRGGKSLRSNRTITAARHGRWSWGPQYDVQRILPGGKFGVGAYLVKLVGYAVKSTGDAAEGHHDHEKRMVNAAARTCSCEHGTNCQHGSRRIPGTIAVFQGKSSQRSCRKHRLAQSGWGFRGHVLSISRKWGTLNFRLVRERRQNFARKGTQQDTRYLVTWRVLRPDPALS